MRAGWIVVLVMVCACAKPHVTFPMVPPDLAPEQRVQMFTELRATRELTTTTTTCRGGCSTTVDKTLYLANGTEIYYPEDVLPVVASDSVTARAIRNVQEQRRKTYVYGGIALAASVVFFVTVFSIYSSLQESALSGESGLSTPQKLGFLVSGGGLLVGGIGSMYHYRQAVRYWGEANESYNEGLAQRLQVCISGIAVVPCESPTMPPSVPAPSSGSLGMAKSIGR